MLCTWGDISFEASHIPDFSEEGGASYAEHALIGRKPKLQYTGETLRSFSLNVTLHWLRTGQPVYAGYEPQIIISRLQSAVDAHKPLPFSWGDGTYEGEFVGESFSLAREQTDSEGRLLVGVYSLTLKEFADNNTAKTAAPAVKATGSEVKPTTAQTQANSGKVSGQKASQGKATSASQVVRQKGG